MLNLKNILIKKTSQNKAVFLDRDGVIIKNDDFIRTTKELFILPGSDEAIKKLNEKGYMVFIITNQAGIAFGHTTFKNVYNINKALANFLKEHGADINKIYCCPYHPKARLLKFRKASFERKPQPGFILKAIKQYKLNKKLCYIVGDMASDIGCGINGGIKTILVKTGFGEITIKQNFYHKNGEQYIPDYIANDLLCAVNEIILKN